MINRRDFLLSTGIGVVAANRVVNAHDDRDDFGQMVNDSNVGRGLDSVLGDYKNRIFIPDVTQVLPRYGDVDLFSFEVSSSQSDFTRITSATAKGKGSYGLAKAKASASVKTFFNSNNYSCHLIGYVKKTASPYESLNPQVLPEIKNFIRTRRNNPLAIERQLGDEVVVGFNLASEIIVVAEFQTNSQEKKKEIAGALSASYKGASGSAKFLQAVRTVRTATQKNIRVMGHFPDSRVDFMSEAGLTKLLNDFNSDSGRPRISSYITRPYSAILLDYPRFVTSANVRYRRRFADELNSLYQTYEDWSADISYVLQENKKSEFDESVIATAEDDNEICKRDLNKLEDVYEASLQAWEERPNWRPYYDPKLLKDFRSTFPTYKQKESTAPPTIRRRPPRKIERTIPDVRGDRGGVRGIE